VDGDEDEIIASNLKMERWEWKMKCGSKMEVKGEGMAVGARSTSTCIRARERWAGRAQLRSLEPTSQWATGSQERRSGYP